MKKIIIITAIISILPALLFANTRPSAKETKKVMDYYSQGKGQGAVLVDYDICREMGKDEQNKNDCVLSLSENDIKTGDELYLWMNFMVPVDDLAEIIITYSRNNRIRETQKVTLSSAFRFRTWKKLATDKPGQWTINIFQDLGDNDIDLGSMSYTVK